jgi:hypothetical protein
VIAIHEHSLRYRSAAVQNIHHEQKVRQIGHQDLVDIGICRGKNPQSSSC